MFKNSHFQFIYIDHSRPWISTIKIMWEKKLLNKKEKKEK